jgi:hypothetical protein
VSEDETVSVELKNGVRFSGTPRSGPQTKDDGVNVLYLTYARAQDADGD